MEGIERSASAILSSGEAAASVTDLPAAVFVDILAKFLVGPDILSLASTCRFFRESHPAAGDEASSIGAAMMLRRWSALANEIPALKRPPADGISLPSAASSSSSASSASPSLSLLPLLQAFKSAADSLILPTDVTWGHAPHYWQKDPSATPDKWTLQTVWWFNMVGDVKLKKSCPGDHCIFIRVEMGPSAYIGVPIERSIEMMASSSATDGGSSNITVFSAPNTIDLRPGHAHHHGGGGSPAAPAPRGRPFFLCLGKVSIASASATSATAAAGAAKAGGSAAESTEGDGATKGKEESSGGAAAGEKAKDPDEVLLQWTFRDLGPSQKIGPFTFDMPVALPARKLASLVSTEELVSSAATGDIGTEASRLAALDALLSTKTWVEATPALQDYVNNGVHGVGRSELKMRTNVRASVLGAASAAGEAAAAVASEALAAMRRIARQF